MLLAQVEGFLEVARRGNVSRAAEAMFVTQPTLTARLHALERELGEPLFARTRRGPSVGRGPEAMSAPPPPLPPRLPALDRERGEPLFARTRRGMRLTDAG